MLSERTSEETPEPWPESTWSSLTDRQLALDAGMAARLTSEDYEFLRDLVTRRGLERAEKRRLFVAAARHYCARLGLGSFDDARVVLREIYLVHPTS